VKPRHRTCPVRLRLSWIESSNATNQNGLMPFLVAPISQQTAHHIDARLACGLAIAIQNGQRIAFHLKANFCGVAHLENPPPADCWEETLGSNQRRRHQQLVLAGGGEFHGSGRFALLAACWRGSCVNVNPIQGGRVGDLQVHHSGLWNAPLFPIADRWHSHVKQTRHVGRIAQRFDDFGGLCVHGAASVRHN